MGDDGPLLPVTGTPKGREAGLGVMAVLVSGVVSSSASLSPAMVSARSDALVESPGLVGEAIDEDRAGTNPGAEAIITEEDREGMLCVLRRGK